MNQEDAKELISVAITGTHAQHWADLGCGAGTFTKALASLLPGGSSIIAIDQQPQHFKEKNIHFHQANMITDALPLSRLDGILLANAFHYVPDKVALIRKLEISFTDSPRFVFVEYDTLHANRWVPYPIDFVSLQKLFAPLGYQAAKLATYPSSFGGMMYAAIVER